MHGGRAIALLLAASLAGCEESSCREVVSEGERYCVTETPIVIEGGIVCPSDLPYELRFAGGIVCTEMPIAREDVPPEVCAMLGGCEEPPPLTRDAGASDAGDAGAPIGSWQPLPDAPHARVSTCAVGPGRIGYFGGNEGTPSSSRLVSGGAEIVLATGAWRLFPTAAAPGRRGDAALVRTDMGWFVFGGDAGSGALGDGAFLADGESSWRALPIVLAPTARTFAAAAWTGREVLVWGGSLGPTSAALGDGAAFDPSAFTWRPIASTGAPSPRLRAASAWTGDEWIVWGGLDDGVRLRDGGAYDPTSDSWRALATSGAPLPRADAIAAWTGAELIVWGGTDATGPRRDGGAYDPVRARWRSIPEPPTELVPLTSNNLVGGLSDGAWIVWGAADDTRSVSAGASFDLAAWRWDPLALAGAPASRTSPCGLTTERGVAVLLGAVRDRYLADGALLELAR